MAAIEIPHEIDSELQKLADLTGQSKESLVMQALEAHLEEQRLETLRLNQNQLDRMRQSIAQLDRGERISNEETDQFFDKWKREIAAR